MPASASPSATTRRSPIAVGSVAWRRGTTPSSPRPGPPQPRRPAGIGLRRGDADAQRMPRTSVPSPAVAATTAAIEPAESAAVEAAAHIAGAVLEPGVAEPGDAGATVARVPPAEPAPAVVAHRHAEATTVALPGRLRPEADRLRELRRHQGQARDEPVGRERLGGSVPGGRAARPLRDLGDATDGARLVEQHRPRQHLLPRRTR